MPAEETANAMSLEEWGRLLADSLGLQDDVLDIELVLNLARDAAHAIARPAAPITTFLVGYAAASAGGSADDVERLAALASRLAIEHAPTASP